MSHATRIETAKGTPSGSGYAQVSPASFVQTADFGACPWCGAERDGKGILGHLENGFDAETLDPTFAPAVTVCAGCHEQVRQMGRLRT